MATLRSRSEALDKAFPRATGERDAKASTGFGFFIRDDRSFQEMLADWMLALGCAPGSDNQTFLNKAGLSGCLMASDWQALLDGTAALEPKLANHLAVLLPEDETRKTQRLPLPSTLRGRAKAVWHDAQEEGKQIIALNDEQYRQLRAPLVERLCATLTLGRPASGEDGQTRESHSLTGLLVERIRQLQGAGVETDAADILEPLARHYRADPKGTVDMLARVVIDVGLPQLHEWAACELKSMNEYHGPGRLLAFFRRCAGLSQGELGKRLGVHSGTISRWELGEHAISGTALGTLCRELKLNPDEMVRFAGLVRPELKETWVRKWAEAGTLHNLSFPTLDATWLKEQPQDKHAGLLLASLRERAGLMREELAKQVGVNRDTISKWERGEDSPAGDKLPVIQTALGLDDRDYRRLMLARFPALGKTALKEQPRHKRAGALLATFRKRAGLTQRELEQQIGLGRDTLTDWELGKHAINDRKLPDLRRVLKLSPEEAAQLARLLAGPALQDYRESAGLLQRELADKIKVHQVAVSLWELGDNPVDGYKLTALCRELKLSPDDTVRFAGLVRPELEAKWIRKWIVAGTLDFLSSPALVVEWLAEQPQEKQARLLLGALRERAGLSQKALAKKIDIEHHTLNNWELGKYFIDSSKLGALCQALNLDADSTVRFARLVRPELEEGWIRQRVEAGQWDVLSTPARNEEWLNGQPQEKRAGLLLAFWRERAKLTQEELAKRIGIDQPGIIANWEIAHRSVDGGKLAALCQALNLNADETLRFARLVRPELPEEWIRQQITDRKLEHLSFPALDAAWLAAQPQDKQGGLLLATYCERGGLTQKELAQRMGISRPALSLWESGKFPIPEKQIEPLIKILSEKNAGLDEKGYWFDEALAQRFRDTCAVSNPIIRERNRNNGSITSNGTAHLGKVVPAHEAPADIRPKSESEKGSTPTART